MEVDSDKPKQSVWRLVRVPTYIAERWRTEGIPAYTKLGTLKRSQRSGVEKMLIDNTPLPIEGAIKQLEGGDPSPNRDGSSPSKAIVPAASVSGGGPSKQRRKVAIVSSTPPAGLPALPAKVPVKQEATAPPKPSAFSLDTTSTTDLTLFEVNPKTGHEGPLAKIVSSALIRADASSATYHRDVIARRNEQLKAEAASKKAGKASQKYKPGARLVTLYKPPTAGEGEDGGDGGVVMKGGKKRSAPMDPEEKVKYHAWVRTQLFQLLKNGKEMPTLELEKNLGKTRNHFDEVLNELCEKVQKRETGGESKHYWKLRALYANR
uniref:Uncharacterized protein n=1 Tax=Chromera velia CCMP2878 TaxID=1169474 RepID=A0A0G4HX83_9ALVE|eukprot:Cvel_9225.t1-p1 / transcript=Cvel_9225.t1 / gene=Cvel_9225 / organism=Chromera_velia_CCMP2878 / gene_product=hypothetical protein / transcript_product=hypothetical protein / location=Cvel_scaffold526:35305-36715(-) / protein_length=320 / sequence_SO=supercontig / SO=protein_coding / is_pseudo=false